jgi:hypothetical protein
VLGRSTVETGLLALAEPEGICISGRLRPAGQESRWLQSVSSRRSRDGSSTGAIRVLRHKPHKWQAISTTKVLGQESTSPSARQELARVEINQVWSRGNMSPSQLTPGRTLSRPRRNDIEIAKLLQQFGRSGVPL